MRTTPSLALAVLVSFTWSSLAHPQDPPSVAAASATPPVATQPPDPAALEAWESVYTVLVHPRCLNCHPVGDAPLQSDRSVPHAMEIDRNSPQAGLLCSTCHQDALVVDEAGAPPAAPHWGLPPANQAFEQRSSAELCRQLKDPETNGDRDLPALHEHVDTDHLILQAWHPGGGRTPAPGTHAEFMAAFSTWVEAEAPCPAP